MTIELKIKLVLWEIKSNHKGKIKELFEELRYEMQLEQDSFYTFLKELESKGYVKISSPNKTDLGNIAITIDGEKHLSFFEEERLDIILNYCKDMASIGKYSVAGWNKVADRSSEGNNPSFNSRVEYLNKEYLIEYRMDAGYVATSKGLMFEGFMAQKSKQIQNEEGRNAFEFKGIKGLKNCPFTGQQVNANVVDDSYEYILTYNGNNFKIKLNNNDWVESNPINDLNRWIFEGMLYNNEWPIEDGVTITPSLVNFIIARAKEYPNVFEEKMDALLVRVYLTGGREYKPVEYNNREYQYGYASSWDEFNRIKIGLVSKGLINDSPTIEERKSKIQLTERGLGKAKDLYDSKIKEDPFVYENNQPSILVVATKNDSSYADRIKDLLSKYKISLIEVKYLEGEKEDNINVIRRHLDSSDCHYAIFVKSASSDVNQPFRSIVDIALEIHERTEKSLHEFLYFACFDDKGLQSMPRFRGVKRNYYNSSFDFRIKGNWKYLLNSINVDWQDRNKVLDTHTEGRVFSFPRVALSKDDEFWLKRIYANFLEGQEPYYSSFISEYWGKEVPSNYDPKKIKEYLLINGTEITFYGIWAIEPTSKYLPILESLIFTVKDILSKPGQKNAITYEMIKGQMALDLQDGLKCLKLLSRLGGFANGYGSGSGSFSITIDSREEILKEYINFESLEKALIEAYPELAIIRDMQELEDSNRKNNLNDEIDVKNQKNSKIPVRLKDRELDPVMGVRELALDMREIIDELPIEQDQMIGIFGRWGRGKSVFISELKKALESSEKVKYFILEYRAWKYQETPASWAYLYEILTTRYYNKPAEFSLVAYVGYLERLINLNIERNGMMPLVKFFGSLALSLSISIGLISWNNISAWIGIPLVAGTWVAFLRKTMHEYGHTANDLIKKYGIKHHFKDTMGLQAEIQKEIITLFNAWIPKNKKGEKIVLIVEDIDRCTEDKIIQNIDSLRVMLEDPEIINRLIIIAAIDDTILKNAVKTKYEKLSAGKKNKKQREVSTEYLDKVFLMAIKLGTLSSKNKVDFLEELLKNQIEETSTKEDSKNNQNVEEPPQSNNTRSETRQNEVENDVTPRVLPYYVIENLEEEDAKKTTEIPPQNPAAETNDSKVDEKKGIEKNSKLNREEAAAIKEVMLNWQDSTPRKMRIFYYRYLLCKLLLYNRYSKLGAPNVWQTPEGIKYLLELMKIYIDLNNPGLISRDKWFVEKSIEQKVDLMRIKTLHTINKGDCINLYEVLELVIAY